MGGGYNNREHIGWQLGSYVVEKVQDIFPDACEKTIRNKFSLEKKVIMMAMFLHCVVILGQI